MANFNLIEIEKALGGIDFPVDKETIVSKARENGAGGEEISALEDLPERKYNNPTEITEALGKNESGDEEDET